jgi:hypothetical protein
VHIRLVQAGLLFVDIIITFTVIAGNPLIPGGNKPFTEEDKRSNAE